MASLNQLFSSSIEITSYFLIKDHLSYLHPKLHLLWSAACYLQAKLLHMYLQDFIVTMLKMCYKYDAILCNVCHPTVSFFLQILCLSSLDMAPRTNMPSVICPIIFCGFSWKSSSEAWKMWPLQWVSSFPQWQELLVPRASHNMTYKLEGTSDMNTDHHHHIQCLSTTVNFDIHYVVIFGQPIRSHLYENAHAAVSLLKLIKS